MSKQENRIETAIRELKFNLTNPVSNVSAKSLVNSFDEIDPLKTSPGKYCGVSQISDIFSWKKGFSYLITGTPNTGKTTWLLFMYLLLAKMYDWKFCIWSPEMEDSYLKNNKIEYHAKDLIYTLMWTLVGKTPYEFYSKKHICDLMTEDERRFSYKWVTDHFKFLHIPDRTPAGIIQAFKDEYDKFGIDGFLIDPWKSVKQIMDIRSDLWLEDTLMTIKTFSMETNSIMSYVVHPKSLKDYKDQDGNFRIINPFDLNGGAAWNNSMDVIVSLRRLEDRTEFYSQKIRKQHLIGKPGSFESMTFNMDTYRYYYGEYDPFN